MIYIYLVFCLICFWIGKTLFKNIWNPICLYSLAWGGALLLHQSKLLVFYELKWYTWATIYLVQVLFVLVSFISSRIKFTNYKSFSNDINVNLQREEIKKYIIITSSLSGVAIINKLMVIVALYGTNLLKAITDIYSDRVNNVVEIESIPYLGAFIYVAIALCGVYLKRYGFSLVIMLPITLGIMSALSSGGRVGLVFMAIIFISAYFSVPKKKEKISKSLKRKIFLFVGVFILAGAIVILTTGRNAGSSAKYASSQYTKIFGDNVFIYKIIQYVGAPIGVLNEYLQTCDFNFGQNSFLTVYNLLSKFGLCDRIEQYQEFFLTPVRCNVGTWIRELVEDFTYPGAILAIIIFVFISTQFYCKARKDDSVKNKIVWSVLAMIIIMSFFDWKFRSSDMWISLLFGYVFGNRIDKKSIHVNSNEVTNV